MTIILLMQEIGCDIPVECLLEESMLNINQHFQRFMQKKKEVRNFLQENETINI